MRGWRGVVLGAVLVVVLSGCSTAPEVDPEAVQGWMQEQSSREVPDSLATLAGLASTPSETIDDTGVATSFEDPTPVSELLFACFGPKAMSADVTISGTDRGSSELSQTIRFDDLACDGESQKLELAHDAATKVSANGRSPDGVGAWVVFVLGKN